MGDNNKRKRANNNTDEELSVGAFPGDTMATALDPFGSAAGPIAGRELDNETEEDTIDDEYHGSQKRD